MAMNWLTGENFQKYSMLHAYLLLLLLANAKPFLLPSGNRCNCPQTPACPSVAECPSVPPPCPVNPPCFARGEKTYHPNDGAASVSRFYFHNKYVISRSFKKRFFKIQN